MSRRQQPPTPSRSSRAAPPGAGADTTTPPPTPRGPSTLAAPKPVRPAQKAMLEPPTTPQWTSQPSPPGYTSFPPPPSPIPNAGGLPVPSGRPAATSSPATSAPGFRSPGPNALTSFPPPPPTPPQRDDGGYFQHKSPAAARVPYDNLATPEKTTTSHLQVERELRPGVFDIDNLEETLHNLRFAPSPMLSTIYSVPSTPREELSTPDFTASTTSCFTPPSTNPTPEPHLLTPRGAAAPALPPPPPVREPVTSPTRPRSNSRRTSPPTRKRGRGVVSCINTPSTFATTWYAHPTAPEFDICARCYEDHLAGTRLENDFRGRLLDDGKPRACLFASPRVMEHLLPRALSEGRTDDLVAFLRRRAGIPDCRGQTGVPGREGQRWFRPRNNAVPNMVVCEACFEDHVLPSPSASNFEPAAGQPANDVWACDFAIPSIRRAHKLKGSPSWSTFCKSASARMALTPCARGQKVAVTSRVWFAPTTSGMHPALVCAACFSDHVDGTGEERRWREVPSQVAARYGSMTRCALGRFDLGVAMSRAHEGGDFGIFWRALDAFCHEESCVEGGMRDGKWFTFPSHPEGFAVCKACVACVVEPLGLAASFVPRCSSSSSATPTVCSLNPASPRFAAYAARLLEGFYVADAGALEAYALEFASLPPCPRDEDFRGGRWYGWQGCAVCPSCYHEFARGTALAASMTLRGEVVRDASLMCEMYSPRMRGLYTEACKRGDVKGLLAAAAARRKVFAETVPVIRQTVLEAQVRRGGKGVVDGPGVGLGLSFANLVEGQPGQGGSVASLLGSGTRSLVVAELERRWREVE
ncbi:integral membrane protein [Colletotrichum plurivorum]|uniref:Integral membrane protein n=1 Tax=Colletotrichum plurivorum TaxID=2175906 RepID=A0A8H6K0P9_9PEZI|nr:integral membrane protein [Colletotrichum plurivorum]